MTSNCSRSFILLCLSLLAPAAIAADVNVVALIRGKATLVIDGGAPRTLAVGQVSPEGVKLVAADSRSATVEIGGKQQTIAAGERASVIATVNNASSAVMLYPDSRGHFFTTGNVNGKPVRFLVDSGASSVVLPAPEAQRLGIAYQAGSRALSLTANGAVGTYRIVLGSVRIGGLELHDVAAEVSEAPMAEALLGMTFLGRVTFQRDSQYLRLSPREENRVAGDAPRNLPGHARLTMNAQGGHFYTGGQINGAPINFVVDTGATMVSISIADAQRMGIDYLRGQQATTMTANGRAPGYLVQFDEVRAGEIVLHNVDGVVLANNSLPVALLGMSFLNRTEIQRDGGSMTLTQRF